MSEVVAWVIAGGFCLAGGFGVGAIWAQHRTHRLRRDALDGRVRAEVGLRCRRERTLARVLAERAPAAERAGWN